MSKLHRAVEAVRDRFVNNPRGDWEDVTPATLLGLYAITHEEVYGVFPEELATDWNPAFTCAKRMLEHSFGGDGKEAVEFIRWVWKKEQREFPRRKSEGSDFTISWKFQFSQKLVTRYRIATQA